MLCAGYVLYRALVIIILPNRFAHDIYVVESSKCEDESPTQVDNSEITGAQVKIGMTYYCFNTH